MLLCIILVKLKNYFAKKYGENKAYRTQRLCKYLNFASNIRKHLFASSFPHFFHVYYRTKV